ncbi:MAG TPA: carbohydrate ABC transporter permease [Aggregatilineales bacterium]|nr:carbohydrate ABC transporter permease [Aggregatilineales bacterium]
MAATKQVHLDTPAQSRSTAKDWQARVGRALLWLGVIIAVVWTLFPFIWAVRTSFMTQVEALSPVFIPWVQFTPTLANWDAELNLGGRETFLALRNSVIIAVGATVVACTIGTLTGYALGRFQYKIGNSNIISWVMSQRFMPPIATLIPIFIVIQTLKLLDTHVGMIIVNTTFVIPFAILIMRDFFADFPDEIEEAAVVDGASPWQVFWRVALPLATPALTAAAIICFAFAWNEFLFASVLATREAKPYTYLVASTSTARGVHFPYLATRMMIAITLPVILSLFVQRYIVRGLTFGAVKG